MEDVILPSPVAEGMAECEGPLATLPEELISLITMELDFTGLVRLRATCRMLNRICRSHQLWQHVFQRSVGVTLPRPFFLTKPIAHCTANDIECTLRRWEEGWSGVNEVKCIRRTVNKMSLGEPPHGVLSSIQLLPGGRWCISPYRDGSVWYYDLGPDSDTTANVEPRRLLPCPFEYPTRQFNLVQIRMAVDYTSPEALGTTANTCHFEQFNLAVVTCPLYDRTVPMSTHVDVWRVRIVEGRTSGGSRLELSDHLSSYTEVATARLLDCSLHGRAVAYSFQCNPTTSTIIVEWDKANGMSKGQDIIRRYIPGTEAERVVLLPGDRIITVQTDSENMRMYNWSADCPASTIQPSGQHHRVDALWTVPKRGLKSKSIGPAFVVNDTLRLTLPTATHLFGLVLPIDPSSTDPTRFETLLVARFGRLGALETYGLHRGASFCDRDQYARSQYRWDDEKKKAVRPRAFGYREFDLEESGMPSPDCLLFDQFSNRVVAADEKTSHFFFLH